MTDTKNPQWGQQNQNFDLEEVVNNTQSVQNKWNTDHKIKSDAEIVSAMQWSTTKKESVKIKNQEENLDNVVNPTPKIEEKKTETIDDILVEEEPKKKSNTKWGLLTVWLLLVLWSGLFLLLKNSSNNTKELTNNTWNIIAETWVETIEKENTQIAENTNDEDNKGLWDNYFLNQKENTIYYKNIKISTDTGNFETLGKWYAKDSKKIYYKWKTMNNVEIDKFKVINKSGNHKLSWIIVNSKNLLEHLKTKKNRKFLMTTIASITNKNQNVKNELTHASVYAMDSFKWDFNELNNLQRGDEMTDLQRAKFGVIFLYVKIIKNLETDQIRMSKAKKELKYFIQNSDKILKEYGPENSRWTTLEWDIWYDQYCVYNDGKLFGCFLNEIFIQAKD